MKVPVWRLALLGLALLALLAVSLPRGTSLAHYCDDGYYTTQQQREDCWWRYWNNQQNAQDLAFQQQTGSASGQSQQQTGSTSGQSESMQGSPSTSTVTSGVYCDAHYSDQKNRENCWWRYWNNQQNAQDLAFQQQVQSDNPWRPFTIVERPTGDGVLTVAVGTDDDANSYITFGETTHVTHQEDPRQRQDWKPDLNEAADEAEAVVINYPTNPADPEDAENYWQAEEEVSSQGKPYMVCFPAETVVVHVDKDGNETTRDYPEECIMITPK
ncbi:MAG: hypothetical protein F4Z18_04235 [Caldilineaceae bacterium SB0666_bin_21]|nr:hypothetical protein [Caldilineaceae bacterium SB0666_bin_21]